MYKGICAHKAFRLLNNLFHKYSGLASCFKGGLSLKKCPTHNFYSAKKKKKKTDTDFCDILTILNKAFVQWLERSSITSDINIQERMKNTVTFDFM